MSTSLVTGGAGFMGSHVAKHCLDLGHDVVVLDDLSGGFADNVPHGALFVEGSVEDVALLEDLFRDHRFDYVYHLAAYAAEGLSHFIRRFNYTNNIIGSVTLLNAALRHDVQVFVFTSSIAVYGKGQLPMREDMLPRPEDPYGIAKYAVELDLSAAKQLFGLDYVIFRPHNVYGEHQNISDPYRNVVGIFMNQLMSGKPMTVFGDGTQTRAFSYIDDVAPIIAKSVEVPEARGEVFNIGADTPYTVNHLAEVVAGALGRQAEIRYLPPRQEVQHAFSSHDKVKKVFGTGEALSLEEGVWKMARWAEQVGARRGRPFEAIELTRNLPESWKELTLVGPDAG